MKLNDFKDELFELLNESDEWNVYDLEADDRRNILTVTMPDRSRFLIECKEMD